MLEANPELTPELVSEILHFTAERWGEATIPELDPFWNRDFGYGIINSYEAVRVAEGIEDVTDINPDLQCFIMNITDSSDIIDISGIAWSKDGEVECVEVRIDGGQWVATQDASDGTWAKWTYRVDLKELKKGNHTIEARAVSGEKHSLFHEKTVFVPKTWEDDFEGTCLPGIAIIILVAGIAVYILVVLGRKKKPI
jgi:hypothetical protein